MKRLMILSLILLGSCASAPMDQLRSCVNYGGCSDEQIKTLLKKIDTNIPSKVVPPEKVPVTHA